MPSGVCAKREIASRIDQRSQPGAHLPHAPRAMLSSRAGALRPELTMFRPAATAAVTIAWVALAAPAAGTLHAQQAPTDRDIAVYAGLHAAAANGDAAEIEKLIAEGERPNIQDANSRTPLHVAAFRKHYEAVRTLLRLGANPNARDLQGFDILTLAAVNNDIELLKIALAGGADPRKVTGPLDGNALISAAHLGHVEIVRALIE